MDGRGSYTSFAFCISKADLSKYKVIGGKYGDALNGLTTYDSSNNIVNVIWTDTITRDPNFDETV
jgi:hypothetical protein